MRMACTWRMSPLLACRSLLCSCGAVTESGRKLLRCSAGSGAYVHVAARWEQGDGLDAQEGGALLGCSLARLRCCDGICKLLGLGRRWRWPHARGGWWEVVRKLVGDAGGGGGVGGQGHANGVRHRLSMATSSIAAPTVARFALGF